MDSSESVDVFCTSLRKHYGVVISPIHEKMPRLMHKSVEGNKDPSSRLTFMMGEDPNSYELILESESFGDSTKSYLIYTTPITDFSKFIAEKEDR